ncbi:hypothetical protein BDQ17DRAFT_1178358, partial [Cyathus striatus]
QSSANGACKISGRDCGIVQSCPHAYSFRISAAERISSVKPCTNVPVECIFC